MHTLYRLPKCIRMHPNAPVLPAWLVGSKWFPGSFCTGCSEVVVNLTWWQRLLWLLFYNWRWEGDVLVNLSEIDPEQMADLGDRIQAAQETQETYET